MQNSFPNGTIVLELECEIEEVADTKLNKETISDNLNFPPYVTFIMACVRQMLLFHYW